MAVDGKCDGCNGARLTRIDLADVFDVGLWPEVKFYFPKFSSISHTNRSRQIFVV